MEVSSNPRLLYQSIHLGNKLPQDVLNPAHVSQRQVILDTESMRVPNINQNGPWLNFMIPGWLKKSNVSQKGELQR